MTLPSLKSSFLSVLLALGLCLSVSLSKAQFIYSDGDFNSSDWTIQSFTSGGPSGSTSRISSGGNPDAYLQVTLSMLAGAGSAAVWAFKNSAVYDPSSQGAIASIGYSEDIKQGGAPQEAGEALLQNGLRYNRFNWTTDTASWTTRSPYPTVDASDYHLDGSQDNGSNPLHPDFSTFGAPITFGFYRNIGGVAGTDFTTTSGLDNWQTTVTQVPEPSTYATIFGLTALAFATYRRWGKKGQAAEIDISSN